MLAKALSTGCRSARATQVGIIMKFPALRGRAGVPELNRLQSQCLRFKCPPILDASRSLLVAKRCVLTSTVALGVGVGCGMSGNVPHHIAQCDAGPTPVLVTTTCRADKPTHADRSGTSSSAVVDTCNTLPSGHFSLWGHLRVLVWKHMMWIVVSVSCLVMATLFQSRHVGRLTANLTVKVLNFDVTSSATTFENQKKELLGTLWSMIYWQAASQALSFIGGALNRIIARRIHRGLQLALYSELLNKDISVFDRHQMGELTQCVEDRVQKLSQVVPAVVNGLPSLFGVPLTLIQMWQASPELAKANASMVVTTVGVLACVYIVGIKRCSKVLAKHKAKATSALTESFYAIRTVQAFDAASQLVNRYEQLLGAPPTIAHTKCFRWIRGEIGVVAGGYAWLEMVQQLAFQSLTQTFHSMQMLITVTTYLTGTQILADQKESTGKLGAPQLEVGSLSLFQQLCADLFRGMFGLAGMGNAFGTAAGDVAAVEMILNATPQSMLSDTATGSNISEARSCKGNIELQCVSFSYKGSNATESKPVLQSCSLHFASGKVTAIVGRSGSGKSTLLDLIQRFYDVDSGTVRLDGADIRSLDVRWLRQQLGKVDQEPALFALSIADNIRLGKPAASDTEVVEAAKRAGAHEFIMDHRDGYDAIISEKGGSLSGGQRQRIAIARALIKDPAVLILDEASSALDAATEREVVDALQDVMGSRTTILVAHRLSTVSKADHIVVLDGGMVCEEGSHNELLALEGKYAELVRLQQ